MIDFSQHPENSVMPACSRMFLSVLLNLVAFYQFLDAQAVLGDVPAPILD
jgi:hypothetical protein